MKEIAAANCFYMSTWVSTQAVRPNLGWVVAAEMLLAAGLSVLEVCLIPDREYRGSPAVVDPPRQR